MVSYLILSVMSIGFLQISIQAFALKQLTSGDVQHNRFFSDTFHHPEDHHDDEHFPDLLENPFETTPVERLGGPEDLRNSMSTLKKWFIRVTRGDLLMQINKYLTTKLPNNENVSDNLEAVMEWALQENEKPLDKIDDALVLALFNLSDLRSVVGTSSTLDMNGCGRRDLKKLLYNNQFTKGRAHVPKLSSGFTRVEYIVHIVMMNHAIDCKPIYKSRFASMITEFDKISLEAVKMLTDAIRMRAEVAAREKNVALQEPYHSFDELVDPGKIMEHLGSFDDLRMAEDMYYVLDHLLEEYPPTTFKDKGEIDTIAWPSVGDERSVQEHKIARMFELYLVEPCMDYEDRFEFLFKAFKFDIVILDKPLVLGKDMDMQEKGFLEGYTRYGLCTRFMEDNLDGLRDKVLNYALSKR